MERRNAIAVDAEELSAQSPSGGGVTVGAAIALCEVPAGGETEEVDEDSGPISFDEVSGTIVDDDEEADTPLTSMRSARSLSKDSPRCFRYEKKRRNHGQAISY